VAGDLRAPDCMLSRMGSDSRPLESMWIVGHSQPCEERRNVARGRRRRKAALGKKHYGIRVPRAEDACGLGGEGGGFKKMRGGGVGRRLSAKCSLLSPWPLDLVPVILIGVCIVCTSGLVST
jgi:hypothetical protein